MPLVALHENGIFAFTRVYHLDVEGNVVAYAVGEFAIYLHSFTFMLEKAGGGQSEIVRALDLQRLASCLLDDRGK